MRSKFTWLTMAAALMLAATLFSDGDPVLDAALAFWREHGVVASINRDDATQAIST